MGRNPHFSFDLPCEQIHNIKTQKIFKYIIHAVISLSYLTTKLLFILYLHQIRLIMSYELSKIKTKSYGIRLPSVSFVCQPQRLHWLPSVAPITTSFVTISIIPGLPLATSCLSLGAYIIQVGRQEVYLRLLQCLYRRPL